LLRSSVVVWENTIKASKCNLQAHVLPVTNFLLWLCSFHVRIFYTNENPEKSTNTLETAAGTAETLKYSTKPLKPRTAIAKYEVKKKTV
jgi:hypothetical protein